MIVETYSVLLLTTCGAAVACGLYAVHGSVTRLNGLFLAICAALAVWAFGLALTEFFQRLRDKRAVKKPQQPPAEGRAE